MPCPFTVLAGIGAVGQAAPTLFVRDHQARPIAWTALATLAVGWTAYFLLARNLPTRIVLETGTVLALASGAWRWVWWTRRHAGPRGPARQISESFRRTLASLRDPWVLTPLVWLTAMLVTEWRGKTQFVAIEYVAVASWVVLALALKRLRRPSPARFEALESFAPAGLCASCPLGFGAGSPDSTAAAEPAAGRASET